MSMDWKLFFVTFTTIFVAELGDKTQFAALALASEAKSTKEVLLGVVIALVAAGTIGVLAGRWLGSIVDPVVLKLLSGALFVVMGVLILVQVYKSV
jgi:putative Ca2+/H+ antiporter (TMEM165/GDT1 family)